jgi:hypothetical protein
MYFDSLDLAAALRKPLWPWIECPVVLLSDFGGKTLLSIRKPLLYPFELQERPEKSNSGRMKAVNSARAKCLCIICSDLRLCAKSPPHRCCYNSATFPPASATHFQQRFGRGMRGKGIISRGLLLPPLFARQREILQRGAPASAFRNDMFDVKGGFLEAIVHQAILAPPARPRPNCARQFFRDAHYGFLPKICNASARMSDNCSLNSTHASSSSLSEFCKCPSLLRSISSCKRWSAFDGKRRFQTDSIQSIGAAIVAFTKLC